MEKDLYEKGAEYSEHLTKLCGLPVSFVDTEQGTIAYCTKKEADHFCSACRCEKCNKLHPYLYGSREAYRWNGKYVYYCPAGLAFFCACVLDANFCMTGSLVAGPFILGDPQDTLEEVSDGLQRELIVGLPSFSTARVNDCASLFSAVATHISGVLNTQRQGMLLEQARLMNAAYEAHEEEADGDYVYQIQCEKQLHDLIVSQDKEEAQNVLNELLGYIYFSCNFDHEQIKVRITELLVLFSRASIDAGGNIRQIFLCNARYLQELTRIASLEELTPWLTGVLHFYISYTFDYPSAKHSDVVYKCMDYIKQNYQQKISLDDIAVFVSLSRSYLSKVFKEETGYSLFSYINHVRIEKSKRLLTDNSVSLVNIAGLCGFEDQSYFTKVFKKETGLSPKRFRDNPALAGGYSLQKNSKTKYQNG